MKLDKLSKEMSVSREEKSSLDRPQFWGAPKRTDQGKEKLVCRGLRKNEWLGGGKSAAWGTLEARRRQSQENRGGLC